MLCFVSADAQTERRRMGTTSSPVIAYDTGTQDEQTSGSTLETEHTIASDANLLVVFIATWLSGGGQSHTAEYNSDAMTSAGIVTAGESEFELFYLVNPDVGDHDIVITPSSSSTEIAMVAGSFKNVSSVNNYTTDSGTSWPFDITVPANSGSWAIACLAAYNKNVDVVSNGVERVTNENGSAQFSCWLFTRTDSGTIDGELSGSTDWWMLGIRANP